MWASSVKTSAALSILLPTYVVCAIIHSDFKQQRTERTEPLQYNNTNTSLSVLDRATATLHSRESRATYYRQETPVTNATEHSHHRKKSDLMSKILPMMVMPFLISSSMIPMMLTSLKFMLLKSLFVGKIAIFLMALNALWKSDNKGGVYSHNINVEPDQKALHMAHYGYSGDEEYGAYVNRRSNPYSYT